MPGYDEHRNAREKKGAMSLSMLRDITLKYTPPPKIMVALAIASILLSRLKKPWFPRFYLPNWISVYESAGDIPIVYAYGS